MKKQREAGQVIDDDKERSGNGTKSDDPHKRDDKINRKREDDEEIISEMRTDFHMKTHAICVLTARCVSAFSSTFAYASGDPSHALSTDEAEDIISQTICSMRATTATPSTSNNPAGAIQAPPPWINQGSIFSSNASILPYASADSSRALSTDEAEDIISQTISSMMATTATPSTSNNPAGAIQAPAAPPLTAQALSKLNSLVTGIFKGACKILGDVIRTYGVSCDIPKQHNNAFFIMDNSSPFNNDFPL